MIKPQPPTDLRLQFLERRANNKSPTGLLRPEVFAWGAPTLRGNVLMRVNHLGALQPTKAGFRLFGCGSKKRYRNETLASGNMDQNHPSCLILSHTHLTHSVKLFAEFEACHGRLPMGTWQRSLLSVTTARQGKPASNNKGGKSLVHYLLERTSSGSQVFGSLPT